MEEVINGILIGEVETKNIMTKSSLPVGGYSVNPYVGCTHACKYCYASFMKRFMKQPAKKTKKTEEYNIKNNCTLCKDDYMVCKDSPCFITV